MKTLYLVRHAKSDWPENTEDFDRPLSEKGKQDAKDMASFLKNNHFAIDLLVYSPAKRTTDTCVFLNKEYQVTAKAERKLYHPNENQFLEVIYELSDDFGKVALFSHNNGISNFANYLLEELLHFPTCGVAVIQIDCEMWSQIESAPKKLLHFFSPKILKNEAF